MLIANPRSGRGDGDLDRALAVLREGGFEISVHRPEGRSEVAKTIRAAASGTGAIVIAGGDGTLNSAAGALVDVSCPFGILPCGTANDLARTLGVPTNLEAAAAVILRGRTRRIDVGSVNGFPFFNVASIGLSAKVAEFHRGPRKRFFGVLGYPLSWLDAYRANRPFRAEISCDRNTQSGRFILLAVGNGRHYGGGMTVSEDAEIDDGILHVYAVKPVGPLGLLNMLPALKFGRLHRKEPAMTFQGKRVRIVTDGSKPLNVDGDLLTSTPARFDLLPLAVEVFVP